MDLSIKAITPETMFERGADAFDDGLGADDHGMNEGAPARKHWQAGWHARRVQRDIERRRNVQREAAQQLVGATPP